MSGFKLDYSSCEALCDQLGIIPLGLRVRSEPTELSNLLIDRIKFGAKNLSRAAGIQRTKSLECFAQAMHFQNWHSLNKKLEEIVSTSPEAISKSHLDSLRFTMVLLCAPEPCTSLPPAQIEAFENFAQRLSVIAKADYACILDMVCSAYCGETKWADVTQRPAMPQLSLPTPLYSFYIDSSHPASGRFALSELGLQLVARLDEIVDTDDHYELIEGGTTETTFEAKIDKEHLIESLLNEHPNFLEAGYELACMKHSKGELKASAKILRQYVEKAKRLLPRNYRAPIRWLYNHNRFFHRMLALQVQLAREMGSVSTCAEFSRKLWKLDPSDRFKANMTYSLCLLELGQYESALKYFKAPWPNDPLTHVTLAFCLFANGNFEGFKEYLSQAFSYDYSLSMVLAGRPDRIRQNINKYGESLKGGPEIVRDFILPVLLTVPGLHEACCGYPDFKKKIKKK